MNVIHTESNGSIIRLLYTLKEDQLFIAHARQDLPNLMGEYRVLKNNLAPTLSLNDLKEIQTRCNKTTPGKWESYIEGRNTECGSDFIMTDGVDIELIILNNHDQDFIAHAHQDIPLLLDAIFQLRSNQPSQR